MVTPEEEFSKYHDKLRGEINNANWHFAIWKYITKIKKDYLHELKQAPAFFGLTTDAHLLSTLMRLNKLFDKREKMKHLHMNSFLDFIEQNLDIFSSQAFEKRLRGQGRYDEVVIKYHIEITSHKVEQDRQKLRSLLIGNLRNWRNKALAHIEKDSVLQGIDVAKKHPINPKYIDDIINTLHEMLNDYSYAYDASAWVKDIPLQGGIQYTLDAIKFKIQSDFNPIP